ncbi:MAG: hypothetical protein HOG35_13320, partial [Candidatus Marinimicrobia bacterium]|nr:hypothetical protein [Candidatus Neomarinimicrobiota bacterium]
LEIEEDVEYKTNNQKLVKRLEDKLKEINKEIENKKTEILKEEESKRKDFRKRKREKLFFRKVYKNRKYMF